MKRLLFVFILILTNILAIANNNIPASNRLRSILQTLAILVDNGILETKDIDLFKQNVKERVRYINKIEIEKDNKAKIGFLINEISEGIKDGFVKLDKFDENQLDPSIDFSNNSDKLTYLENYINNNPSVSSIYKKVKIINDKYKILEISKDIIVICTLLAWLYYSANKYNSLISSPLLENIINISIKPLFTITPSIVLADYLSNNYKKIKGYIVNKTKIIINNFNGIKNKKSKTFTEINQKNAKEELKDLINYIYNKKLFDTFNLKQNKLYIITGSDQMDRVDFSKAFSKKIFYDFIYLQIHEMLANGIEKEFEKIKKNKKYVILISGLENFELKDKFVSKLIFFIQKHKENNIFFISIEDTRKLLKPLQNICNFEKILKLEFPKPKERKLLITKIIEKSCISTDIEIDEIVKKTDGYSYNKLEKMINRAIIKSITEKELLKYKHFSTL